jgi:hypothetical protein
MQLDLFEHGRDVVLRNDAILAARAANAADLALALAALVAALPNDPLLPDLEAVLNCLMAPVEQHASRAAGARSIQVLEQLAAAVRRTFGAESATWMAPHWVALADALSHLPYDPADDSVHAAPLLLRAQQWHATAAAIESIPSWRKQPVPLAWRTEAEYRSGGLAAMMPLLVELAWMAPARAAVVAASLDDEMLARLLREFDHDLLGDGEAGDFCWFPTYLLIAAPHWASVVRQSHPGNGSGAERATRQVLELYVMERQGRQQEMIAGRRNLRDLDERLFGLYMRSRQRHGAPK